MCPSLLSSLCTATSLPVMFAVRSRLASPGTQNIASAAVSGPRRSQKSKERLLNTLQIISRSKNEGRMYNKKVKGRERVQEVRGTEA